MDEQALITGAWDIHVHAAPSLFPRWGDAFELAQACHAAGMAGFVLKFHHGSSVELANVLDRRADDLRIFGGVTLNQFVGGINPHAVDCAMALGAKVIWLPTIHSAQHEQACGCLGGFAFQKAATRLSVERGLTILDDEGKLLPAMQEILSLLDGQETVLATGHVSPKEIRELQRVIATDRRRIRLLINHVCFKTPRLSARELEELAQPWTWFETVHLSTTALAHAATAAEIASLIQAVPRGRWILASDSGQKGNLRCPEALREFAQALQGAGISHEQVIRMLKQEPAALLLGE